MRATLSHAGMLAGLLAGMLASATRADEFLALPGLWKTTYEAEGVNAPELKVVWHCVDEQADPWTAFAQLQDLPGMTCSRSSLQRNSTSLKWKTECRGPATNAPAPSGGGAETAADAVEVSGAIVFDSAQHYTGWVKFRGTLMGYPLYSGVRIEGTRKAACTSPSD